jgi:hypothetical protein
MSDNDWRAVVYGRANLLLEGSPADIDRHVASLTRRLGCPIHIFRAEAPPQFVERTAIVVQEVGRLSLNDQQLLLSYLDNTDHRVQVISTSSVPLFQLLQHGSLLPDLYYRLNIIRMVLDPGSDPPS